MFGAWDWVAAKSSREVNERLPSCRSMISTCSIQHMKVPHRLGTVGAVADEPVHAVSLVLKVWSEDFLQELRRVVAENFLEVLGDLPRILVGKTVAARRVGRARASEGERSERSKDGD